MAFCCGKRFTGICLIILAVTTIIFGLIIARVIPDLVMNALQRRVCIAGEDNPNFQEWISTVKENTSLYYWHIVNKDDFLYNGKTPKLQQKGPYVYTTSVRKIDVSFDNITKTVTYKNFIQQEFDESSTKEKCPSCNENDKLSILNVAYVATMAQAGSDFNLCLSVLPDVIQNVLKEMDSVLGGRNSTLEQLGKRNGSISTIIPSLFPPGWSNPEFGSWIGSHKSFSTLLRNQLQQTFSIPEMAGLYNVLGDPIKLGIGLNESHRKQCETDPTLTSNCGLLIYLKSYATDEVKANSYNTSDLKGHFKNRANITSSHLNALLCPHQSACFNKSDFWIPLLEYVTKHLMQLATWSALDSKHFQLVSTRTQREFALGYKINELRMLPLFPGGLFVRGILTSHRDENEAKVSASSLTLYTCFSTSGKEFTLAAVNGESMIKQKYFPNAALSDLKIDGYTGSAFPGVKELNTCDLTHSLNNKSFDLYLSDLHIKSSILHTKNVVHHGIKLQRYEITKHMVDVNNVSVFYKGLIDLSLVYGFPYTASFPSFLHGESRITRDFYMTPNVTKHGSFVDIDPLSGQTMKARFRIQLNTAVLPEMISSPRQLPLNVSYISGGYPHSKVIPLYWLEKGAEIDEASAKEYENKVYDRLRSSCAVRIVLSVIGGVFFLFGLVMVILSRKGNHVSPTTSEDEESET